MLINKLFESLKPLDERKNLIPLEDLENKIKKELNKDNINYIYDVFSQLALRATTHFDEIYTINSYINRIQEILEEHLAKKLEENLERV